MSIDDRLERLGLTPELIERWHEVNDPEPNDEHHQPEPDDGPDPATLRWLDEQTTPPTTTSAGPNRTDAKRRSTAPTSP